jgi:hypothetical protein
LFFISEEASGLARGIVELDKAATVKRTKNMRDGFEYVIRIDAPNSASGSGATAAGSKRWTKLVMVLRNEPAMTAWIEAIRSGIEGDTFVASSRPLFVAPPQQTSSMVVFQGKALKEVPCARNASALVSCQKGAFRERVTLIRRHTQWACRSSMAAP